MSDKDKKPNNTEPTIEDGIGLRIKATREARKLSLTDMHNKTGLSRTVLTNYEAGRHKPGAREIKLICDALQISPYTDSGFKCLWQRVQVKWAEQGGKRFTFHDIRAKALTDAKNKGMDAQTLAGHSSASMTEHYIKQREFKRVTPLK